MIFVRRIQCQGSACGDNGNSAAARVESCTSFNREIHSERMHPSSYDKMAAFRQKYLAGRESEPLLIFDLGSQDINGSYRPLFSEARWTYLGIDMAAGKNVDIVLHDPYDWREIEPNSADVFISGQTFEHTEFFWLTAQQIARALKPSGICCILAPSSGPEHQYPVDCWRVYPDGFRAVARYAGLETLECWTQWEDLPQYDDESNKWHDSLLVAQKPPAQACEPAR